jgi:hypothetical protein
MKREINVKPWNHITTTSKINNYSLDNYFTILIEKDGDEMIKLEPNKQEGYFNRALSNSQLNNDYASINDYQKIINLSKCCWCCFFDWTRCLRRSVT